MAEARRRIAEKHPVLRPLGASQGGKDGGEIELQGVGENGRRHAGLDPQALFLGIGLHQSHPFGRPARRRQIVDGGAGHREEAAGGAIFRGHIGDGRLIFHREAI